MNDLMRHLYDYAQDVRVPGLLDQAYCKREKHRAAELMDRLKDSLSESQFRLFTDFQNTVDDLNGLEAEAIFLAAFRMARELS